jgi:rod shape-determining protein MreB and related proteins
MFGLFGADIGIDLGTATVLVYMRGKGIVLKEPSVVAIDTNTGIVQAVGEEARKMIGRTPAHIVAVRPLRDGVISDYDTTEKMIKHFIDKALGRRRFIKPRIVICVPSGVTGVEKRAVEDAALQAGAGYVKLIEEPIAAAIGAGLDITKPTGNMVVDIGGGTTDVAVISLGGIVVSESVKVAGDRFDEAIVRHMRKAHNMLIGERTAEEMKVQIGCATPKEDNKVMEVRGRDLVSGLPKNIQVNSEEMLEALRESVDQVAEAVHTVLERTPPELAADICTSGLVMTGGGSLLWGLDKHISKKTGVPVRIAEDAVSCVAVGTGKSLDWIDKLEGSNTTDRRQYAR